MKALATAALAAPLFLSLPISVVYADATYETPPVLDAADAAPSRLLTGEGFRVDPKVPTDGLTSVFTLRSDAGIFEVRGSETLALRTHEIPAIVTLERSSKAETFISAVRNTAVDPIGSAAQIVANPVETIQGLPGGLERFFDRVSEGARAIASAAGGSETDVAARGEDVASLSAGAAANAFGYDAELRLLARQLGVDPYTSNPVLAARLHEFAKVAFAGHVATNTLLSVAIPASLAITGVNATRDLVYDTPSGDLVARNAAALRTMGVSDERLLALQRTPGFTLTLQTDLVEGLKALGSARGAPEVVALAATVRSADQALFLVRGLRILRRYQTAVAPIDRLTARGTLAAVDRGGALVVPAAVDHVSWTERVAGFAERADLAAAQRSLWLTGRMTPRAKAAFGALGWRVREHVSDAR